MELTREQIDYAAHLARIALTDAERALFGSQLASVLAYFDKLNELDTAGVEPMAHVLGLHNVFRDDLEAPCTPRREILANAPARAYGSYLVPQVLD